MLESLLQMAGIDPAEMQRLKGELDNTLVELKLAKYKLDIMAAQMAEMHTAFFAVVPRPANSQPIQDAELINDELTTHTVGDVVELNTPETAFKVN